MSSFRAFGWRRLIPRIAAAALVVALVGGSLFGGPAAGAEVRIGGTGSALGLADGLGRAFVEKEPDTRIQVLPSLGSSGAIRALLDGAIDVAVTARSLAPEEAAAGLLETRLGRSPFGLVTSHPAPASIARDELASLYRDPAPRWHDGTPLRLILRPDSDTDSRLLAEHFDGMADALTLARGRPEVPVAGTDQDNLRLAQRIAGSLTAASLTQVVTEGADLRLVPIGGLVPSLQALESGRYALAKELFVVVRGDAGGSTRRFLAFLASEQARRLLRDAGTLP